MTYFVGWDIKLEINQSFWVGAFEYVTIIGHLSPFILLVLHLTPLWLNILPLVCEKFIRG